MIAFAWQGTQYKVRYRNTSYVFQSKKQTGFYSNINDVNFDFTNNSVIKDKINVLSINDQVGATTQLGIDYMWQVEGPIVEIDGYIDPAKIEVSFYNHQDSGRIGQIINPDSFTEVVGSNANGTNNGYAIFKFTDDGMGLNPVDPASFIVFESESAARQFYNNVLDNEYLYYFIDSDTIKTEIGRAHV